MKIMRVKQQDGTIVDIPMGMDSANAAINAHNVDASAHPNIREQISKLSSEKVDKTGLSLGIASDGLVYIFIDGSPVGTGIPQGVSGDVLGYVDENNNIVLTGNLTEGTYSIKYEMEDGSTIDIGDMVLDSNVYYSITNTLTNCANTNSAKSVVEGGSYSATISANNGYELSSVIVTMGGTDISASAVSGGNISIASATGDIVITAIAESGAVSDGYDVYTEFGYTDGKRQSASNGQIKDGSGYVISGAIPMTNIVGKTVTVRTKGLTHSGGSSVWGVHSTNSESSNAAVISGIFSDNTAWQNIQKSYDDSGDVIVSTFVFPETYADCYLRISAKGSGATAILTIDKEITA